LYGHVEVARLFYNELHQSLTEKNGIHLNQYDPCVYNKSEGDNKTRS
jgi:hypothetical protein